MFRLNSKSSGTNALYLDPKKLTACFLSKKLSKKQYIVFEGLYFPSSKPVIMNFFWSRFPHRLFSAEEGFNDQKNKPFKIIELK
jgi:hypothetical protein